jgi:integrase
MGSVFKKTYTKPLPAGAELFSRKGQRFARWKDRKGKTRTAAVTTGKNGTDRLLLESPVYVAKYRDGAGVVQEVSTGCRDEQAARQVLADLERRAELVRAGVLTSAEDRIAQHQATPIAEHFAAFDQHLTAKGDSDLHRSCLAQRLHRLAAECAFGTLADLHREGLERWLAARSAEGMAARTRNHYRDALVTFGNWCVVTNRLPTNPFAAIAKLNEKADPRRQRRAMEETELVRLLDVARRRPLLDAATVRRGKRKGEAYARLRDETRDRLELLGRERALTYKTLVLTGLRKGELASLTVAQLHLDDAIPFVALDAADEKNREGNEIVLRDDLAEDLRQWLADKLARMQAEARKAREPIPNRLPGDTLVFEVPTGLLRILNRDLRLAGIPKRDERGRTLDVHALRTTFGTLLSKGGVAPRTAQAAMRHSDIKLTMQVYTDPKLLDVRGALDTLPALPLDSACQESEVIQATGTDDLMGGQVQACGSSLAPVLAPTWCNERQPETISVNNSQNGTGIATEGDLDVTSTADKRKEPLTGAVSGSPGWALRDSNPRPHGCDPCALAS